MDRNPWMPESKVWPSLSRLSLTWCALYSFSCRCRDAYFAKIQRTVLAAGIRSRPDGRVLLLSREGHLTAHLVTATVSWNRSQWPRGLRPLAFWECGFESQWGHGWLSVVSVVCLQVEVSATRWSLVQRSPSGCVCVCVCVCVSNCVGSRNVNNEAA